MNAIELKDVFRVHSTPEGDAAALQGLSLRVADGEVVTVLGPSGSGKSTLLRLLAGLDRPSAGLVRVYGDDLAKLPARRLAKYRSSLLGYADQHYSRALAPELSARELVAVQLGLHGVPGAERRRRAEELLDRVGLSALGDRRPTELSGGEQQRVALCAALAHRPKVFLADEPTGELDAATAEQVYDVMAELVREHHCTTVIVSHDPESARIADRIVRIRDGRVSEEWSREDGESDAIVVGRGGWLRLPEELLLRAGIGSHARRASKAARSSSDRHAGAWRRNSCRRPRRCPSRHEARSSHRHVTCTSATAGQSCSTGWTPSSTPVVCMPSSARRGPARRRCSTCSPARASDAGAVTIDEIEMTALDRTARAALRRDRIAYVGQQAGLVPHLSALENVELALALRGRDDGARQVALAALESVGLAERTTQHVSRLSQGERARVAIARALAAKPKLLLADEPTSRLDGANAISVAVLLAQLARDTGCAVVCSTHDPLVLEQADERSRSADGRRARRPAAVGRAHVAAADVEDAVGHAVEEVAVVRDEDGGALERLERALEHLDGVDVEVVRRLVEEQAVRAAEHQQQELQPRPLAARQRARSGAAPARTRTGTSSGGTPPLPRRSVRRGARARAASRAGRPGAGPARGSRT